MGTTPAAGQDIDGVLDALRERLDADAQDGEAFEQLAGLLVNAGRVDEACEEAERYVAANATDVGALVRAATMYRRADDHEEAARLLRHAHYLDQRNVGVITSLVHIDLGLGHVPEAFALMQLAVAAAPRSALVHFGLGNVFYRIGRLDEALDAYRRAIALEPGNAQFRYMPSFVHLMRGDYREGWIAYEERLDMPTQKFSLPNVKERLWFGEDLAGHRLLVHTEQGLGDAVQFVRYIPMLRESLGPDVQIILLCPASIAPILRTVAGWDELHPIAAGNRIDYTRQIPLMSLPHRFGTLLEEVPAEVPYVHVPPGTTYRLDAPPEARLRVGIAWAGNPQYPEDRTRSVDIADLAPLFDLDDVWFYSLQFGERGDAIDPWLERPNVVKPGDAIGPFVETLAAIDQLDLVITIDSVIGHLAGALGRPVWLMLQFGSDWRWMLDREDSPWYPNTRLFRQQILGDWPPVVRRLRAALEEYPSPAPSAG